MIREASTWRWSDRRGCECQRSLLNHRLRRSIEVMFSRIRARSNVLLLDVERHRRTTFIYHRMHFLWPQASHDRLCHSCDAPEIPDMQSRIAVSKEVKRISAPTPLAPATSDCVNVFVRSGLPAEVATSSVTALTSWPFGRKLKGGHATRNRCCKAIQLIHVHVLVDKRSATPGLQKKILSREPCVS